MYIKILFSGINKELNNNVRTGLRKNLQLYWINNDKEMDFPD